MSYYHTARAHVKSLKSMSDDNKRKAERRAEVANVQAELPVNILRVDGRTCKMIRSDEQYRAVESTEGMIPWNGQVDNLIDRFDGRALLDFYKDPPPASRRKPQSEEELELEQLVGFEAFRDLVHLMQCNVTERQGLDAAIKANLEHRAQAVAAATAEAGLNKRQLLGQPPSTPAVIQYSAVGFSYGAGAGARSSSGDSDSDSDASTSSEEDRDDEDLRRDRAADDLAANVGIDNFSLMLRRAEQHEEDEVLGRAPQKRRVFSRKKAAERAKRMAGQGLAPKEKPAWKPDREKDDQRSGYGRRDSPEYMPYRPRSPSPPRGRDRSRSPRRHHDRDRDYNPRSGRTEYITEFRVDREHRQAAKASAGTQQRRQHAADLPSQSQQGSASHKRSESFLDAIPSRMADPAVNGGPVLLPSAGTTLQGVKAGDWRQAPIDRRSEREIRLEAEQKAAAAASSKASSKAPLKETPMERLKRLRAAQLNKTFQNEVLTNTQKRAAEERERQARMQIERAARAYSRSRSDELELENNNTTVQR
ncbi:hypothetical protein WJX73_010573 [Symbiochloris irregularis]|uniref:Suppressor of white apricot N-terminal domain-containing protein n=1 Tax=Symbiochloris irregularis TaxID=706552 RepID=A0AAW1Q331_9CHLO